VHQAQAAQARLPGARAADVGQHQLPRIADDDVLHLAAPVEQHAHLATHLARDFGEVPRQLGRNQLARLDAAPIGGEQALALARLQAFGISREIVSRKPSSCDEAALSNTRLLHLLSRQG